MDPSPQRQTIGVDFGNYELKRASGPGGLEGQRRVLQLWDTAGDHRFATIIESTLT
jgi:hypothetical protein